MLSTYSQAISEICHLFWVNHSSFFILNKVYDIVGFDALSNNLLHNLVIANICQPGNKMATTTRNNNNDIDCHAEDKQTCFQADAEQDV